MTRFSIPEYRLTGHAQLQMKRRQITEVEVTQVLIAPEQVVEVRGARVVCQSTVCFGEPSRTYLLRVIVDTDRQPPQVVTVYRATRISRYWREKS